VEELNVLDVWLLRSAQDCNVLHLRKRYSKKASDVDFMVLEVLAQRQKRVDNEFVRQIHLTVMRLGKLELKEQNPL
jgi:hypothetical protein